MASKRTIVVGKQTLDWDTGSLSGLVFDHNNIVEMYKNVVKPGLLDNVTSIGEVRHETHTMVEKAIADGKVKSMSDWVYLVLTLKMTDIIFSSDTEYEVKLLKSQFETWEKYSFWNIAKHMNHHCKQLWRCCFVCVTDDIYKTQNISQICWAGGFGYDKHNDPFFLDRKYDEYRYHGKTKRW